MALTCCRRQLRQMTCSTTSWAVHQWHQQQHQLEQQRRYRHTAAEPCRCLHGMPDGRLQYCIQQCRACTSVTCSPLGSCAGGQCRDRGVAGRCRGDATHTAHGCSRRRSSAFRGRHRVAGVARACCHRAQNLTLPRVHCRQPGGGVDNRKTG
jgi:hypothetical protein